MKNDGFTSGQAAGITHASVDSIWRYVKDFEECFSPGAKQKHSKRFSQSDIRTIMVIRKLYLERKKKSEILQALQEGDLDYLPEHYDLESFGAVAVEIQNQLKQAKDILRQAQEVQWRLKNQQVGIDNALNRFRKELAKYDERIVKLEYNHRLEKAAEQDKSSSWVERLRSRK